MTYLAWDGEDEELYLLSAPNMDVANEMLSTLKEGSDGDEFSLVPVPVVVKGSYVKVMGLI